MNTKTCIACGVGKPKSEYGRKKNSKDGLNNKCRACVSEYLAQWRDRAKETAIKQSDTPKICASCGCEYTTAQLHTWCTDCRKKYDAIRYAKQSDGVTDRNGCLIPDDCKSLSHKLCHNCSINTEEYISRMRESSKRLASTEAWKKRCRLALTSYWERRRDDEQFEAYMLRMEQEEAAELEAAQSDGNNP